MSERDRPSSEALAAYLEDELGAADRADCERELSGSPLARQRLERLRALRDTLSAPIPELERVDLVAGVRAGLHAPAPRRTAHTRLVPAWWVGAAAVAAVAAVAASFALFHRGQEFRAKSAATSASPDSWAGFRAYRVPAGGAAGRLGGRLNAQDGLTFSYTNLGPKPFEYLLIFAVDARREVRWFHPAYTELGQDPQSIAIVPGAAETELPDVITHDLAPGPLALHAVFSHQPLHVLEIERLLAQTGNENQLPLPDTSQQTLRSVVEP